MKKYDVIYADPAWEYNIKECLAKTSILNGKLNTHYGTMTLKDLKALDVKKQVVQGQLNDLKLLQKNYQMLIKMHQQEQMPLDNRYQHQGQTQQQQQQQKRGR